MYNIKEIKKALSLLNKYDYTYTKVSRELGIPITTLRMWRNKEIKNLPLIRKSFKKRKKWSDEEVKVILDYYFEHGENGKKAVRKFGYPKYSTFMDWVHADPRFKKTIIYTANNNRYTFNDKKSALVKGLSDCDTISNVAKGYGVSRTTIYNWRDELLGDDSLKKKKH